MADELPDDPNEPEDDTAGDELMPAPPTSDDPSVFEPKDAAAEGADVTEAEGT